MRNSHREVSEELGQIASHYKIDFDEEMLKDDLKAFVILTLFERGVLAKETAGAAAEQLVVRSRSPVKHESLPFEQQERLLQMQLEEMKLQIEDRKLQIELEQTKLKVLERGGSAQVEGSVSSMRETTEAVANLHLVPKFNERDPDTFFTLFERVAAVMAWSDADRILLLQCVLTGKAQEAYSAICAQDNLSYECVKSTVLKAYQLTAEAYRQRFRQWIKAERQTHVEFVSDLTTHFKRWCMAAGVTTFDQLSELIILEQFKNVLTGRVVTYLNEREPDSVVKAAQLADDFVLTHRMFNSSVRPVSGEGLAEARAEVMRLDAARGSSRRSGNSDVCHNCRGVGHWKNACPLLDNARMSPALLCAEVSMERSNCSGFEPFITSAFVSLEDGAQRLKV
ncbi:hypothetical protein WMY93_027447 [Mugilogobius chulae]|uniref:SCAN box domain-containing protein n=1 Tax=Mugilogobius chulae TaxID=88201 RepID=A0AAW0MZQ6_9GOBI